MRLKYYSLRLLQMVPWCFAAAMSESDLEDCSSSSSSSSSPSGRPLPIRVVGADGVVRIYDFPVSAAEVMTDNPCHLVCRADAAFTIGQKVPALSPADSLLPGHSYFLLPSQFFHSVLSFVSLASSLLVAAPSLSLNGGSNSSSSNRKVRPFRICRSATGALQIIVCSGDDGDGDGDGDQLINSNKNTKAEDDKERMSSSRVCTDEALEKEYREMVGARRERRWTPKLETIGECEMERRRRRRRGGGGGGGGGEGFRMFGFARRKRGTTQ